MIKVNFKQQVLPHIVAVLVFLIIEILFFKPFFLDNKVLSQHDIQQFLGSSKEIADYREQTGEEALWTNSMFGGMPAYLISVKWDYDILLVMRSMLSLGIPAPISHIFLAFVCYYIMLLTFGISPWRAMAGAVAFGLSSYLIVGLTAGHNGRIGAVAFMPLAFAGIHLVFSGKRVLGFAVTAAGLALHLRENHLQMTYYLLMIVGAYSLMQLVYSLKEKKAGAYIKNIGIIGIASIIAFGTFFGQFWAITEYSKYSIRGKSELTGKVSEEESKGLSKTYAFEYSNGILEPLTMLIPNFYGGSSANSLLSDRESETYQVLSNVQDKQTQQILATYYSRAYWGPQSNTTPYYAGAIVCFLFAIGIAFAEKKHLFWIIPLVLISIMLTWGSNFKALNYFLFDFLPGYNKFRSVTFALIITLFTMPLLGLLGLEKFLTSAFDKKVKKKLFIAFAATGGLCLVILVFTGAFDFISEFEITAQLPDWYTDALTNDRKELLTSDTTRSLIFITLAFVLIYFSRKIPVFVFSVVLTLLVTIDLAVVDRRFISKDNYQRKNDKSYFEASEADKEILSDTTIFRVYNLMSLTEARTSYYHQSVGGYHGAKIRRYQDLIDSCFAVNTEALINNLRTGNPDINNFGVFNMLNVKYFLAGASKAAVIQNEGALGNAWLASDIRKVNNADEELKATCEINAASTAVVDGSRFNIDKTNFDASGSVTLTEYKPSYLKYKINAASESFVVFSEIYYPEGWQAVIDGQPAQILRANYVLRAMIVPAGDHTIEFTFKPDSYYVGNKITVASCIALLIVVIGSAAYGFVNARRVEDKGGVSSKK